MKIWGWGPMPLVMVCGLWFAAACDEAAGDEPPGDEATTGEPPGNDPPGAEASCEGDDSGPCAAEGLCDAYSCGGRAARFNHFGCARVSCRTDAECPAGEACFSLAFERICEPASTTCTAQGDACVCEATDDCDGLLDAHCLPTQFYPPAEYCDPSVFSCEDLPAWADALQRAAEAADPSLADPLSACAQRAQTMAGGCS